MKKDYEEFNWECAVCFAPAKYKKMQLKGQFGLSFPTVMIEKSCECEEDKFMNRTKGRFLSPETW